jgi:uncharacterized membrane protein HdeD (DUF308 family)
MEIPPDQIVDTELRQEPPALRRNWLWFVLLGVVLIFLGFIALWASWIASLAAAVAIGVVLLMGGVAETVGAFFSRRRSGFFLHLLSGVLSLVAGVLFLQEPPAHALTWVSLGLTLRGR